MSVQGICKHEFVIDSMGFFCCLHQGNNMRSIRTLLYDPAKNPNGYIDFTQALLAAKDDEIDYTLRLRYAEIILVMFVDVGDNRSFLDNLCYSFVSISTITVSDTILFHY